MDDSLIFDNAAMGILNYAFIRYIRNYALADNVAMGILNYALESNLLLYMLFCLPYDLKRSVSRT